MTYRLIAVVAVLAVAACTRAPLTDPKIVLRGATRGDVPRDANGEPMLGSIRPIPPGAIVAPPPTPAPPTPR